MSTIANKVTREILSHGQLSRPTTLTTLWKSTRWTPRFVTALLRPFTTTAIVVDRTRNSTASSSSTIEGLESMKFTPVIRIQTPWTEKENQLLRSKIREGLTTMDFHMDFPRRSVSALVTQMHKQRIVMKAMDQEAGIESNYLQKSKRLVSWTKNEDAMLIQLVRAHQEQQSQQQPGQQQGDPEEAIDWTSVAETMLNGERLGRTSSSCQRRWVTLNPKRTQGEGHWTAEEDELLMKALRFQVPALNETITEATDLAGLDLKLVDWNKISREVGTRGATGCRGHFIAVCYHATKECGCLKKRRGYRKA